MKKVFLMSISILISVNLISQYAVLTSAPVNLRDKPSTEGKVVASLMKNYIIVGYISDSKNTEKIKIWNNEFEEVWKLVKIGNMQCYIYSPFVEVFKEYPDADKFVERNKKVQAELKGKKAIRDEVLKEMNKDNDASDFYYQFTFEEDGKFKIEIDGIEGDHVLMEKGVGRFIVYDDHIIFRAAIQGEFAPEGYSWEEYFLLAVGHKPTKQELKKYIKENKTYKKHFYLNVPMTDTKKTFKSVE